MKSKYYINGEPLVDFCRNHPEYNYGHLIKYISVQLKKDSSRPVQELIEEYINKSHKTYTRYAINGMCLYKYCDNMGISYDAVIKDISRSRKNKKHIGMAEEEFINSIVEKHIAKTTNIEKLVVGDSKKLVLKPNEDDSNK